MKPNETTRTLRRLLAGLALCLAWNAHAKAADTARPAPPPPAAAEAASADPLAAYKAVDLKTLVGSSRTEVPGQRVIFVPTPVRFQARLAALPAPQKTDYLKKALGMMGAGHNIQVSQRIGLDYGGDKALVAYIDDVAAAQLAKDGKVGQAMDFYAYHVYNHSRGPALVVVAIGR
ncbi:MAG: hypothetical protein QM739_07735 [Propionivibrio sp.]